MTPRLTGFTTALRNKVPSIAPLLQSEPCISPERQPALNSADFSSSEPLRPAIFPTKVSRLELFIIRVIPALLATLGTVSVTTILLIPRPFTFPIIQTVRRAVLCSVTLSILHPLLSSRSVPARLPCRLWRPTATLLAYMFTAPGSRARQPPPITYSTSMFSIRTIMPPSGPAWPTPHWEAIPSTRVPEHFR